MIESVGLIGDPVAHSVSPAMHNAAFAHYGLPDRYALWHTRADVLADRVAKLRAPNMRGANVTLPHKSAVVSLVDELDSVAAAIGAVNTIVRDGGRLLGRNTDVEGFLRALSAVGFDPAGKSSVVLGAGGATRAVAYGLLGAGVQSLVIGNRTLVRAEALVADLRAFSAANQHLAALAPDDPELAQVLAEADVLINATSVGLDRSSSPLPPQLIGAHLLVVDLIYHPTPLLQAAATRGARTQDGLEMLIQQGALAFEIWTGLAAPVDVMRAAVHQTLKERT